MIQKLSILLLLGSALSIHAMQKQVAAPAVAAQDEEQLFELLKTQFHAKKFSLFFFEDLDLIDLKKDDGWISPHKTIYAKLMQECGKNEFYSHIMKELAEAKRLFTLAQSHDCDNLKQARATRFFCGQCLEMIAAAFPEERQTQNFQNAVNCYYDFDVFIIKWEPKNEGLAEERIPAEFFIDTFVRRMLNEVMEEQIAARAAAQKAAAEAKVVRLAAVEAKLTAKNVTLTAERTAAKDAHNANVTANDNARLAAAKKAAGDWTK